MDIRHYRVLIASPSDLPEERDAIQRAIHEWNDSHTATEGVVLTTLRWEARAAIAAYNVGMSNDPNKRGGLSKTQAESLAASLRSKGLACAVHQDSFNTAGEGDTWAVQYDYDAEEAVSAWEQENGL